MKNLFVSIICFHLILGQSAHALEDQYLKTGTGSQGGYDFYSKQIMGLGTSIIGASILKQCLSGMRIPSIATFMAGSAVNIYAEIDASKDEYQYKMTKLSQIKIKEEQLAKKGGEFQRQLLVENLDSEKKSVEFLKKRKAWMIAVDAIYMTAAGLALAEQSYGTLAAIGGGTGKCAQIAAQQASSCTTGYAACYAAHFGACSGLHQTGVLTAQANFTLEKAKTIAEQTCSGTAIYKDACDTALKIYTNLAFGACKSIPTDGGLLSLSFPKLLSMGWGFMAGRAGGDGAINKYGKMMYTLLGLLVPKLQKTVPKLYNFPMPRFATFGAFSLLAISITSGLEIRQQKAEANVALLEKALRKFELETSANGGLAESLPNANDYAPVEAQPGVVRAPASIAALPTASAPRECLSLNGEASISSANCSSPIKFSSPDFSHMPTSTLTNVSNQAIQLANAVSIGDTKKAELLAGEISAQATRVRAEVETLQRNYNETQKSNNQKPLDFNQLITSNLQAMNKDLADSTAASSIKPSDVVAAETNEGEGNHGQKSLDSSVAKQDMDLSNIPTVALPEVPDFAAGLGASNDMGDIDRNIAGEAAEDGKDFISQVPLAKEVAPDPYESIFKRVSDRYILNYSKIFEKKKTVDESTGIEF